MSPAIKLTQAEEGSMLDNKKFQFCELVGSLLYLSVCTRPDIAQSAALTLLRDIDVMFCGDAIGNKQQLKTLAQLGVNITIARPTLTNQDIDALFLRSKIVLQQGDGLLEATRTMHALSLQTMVISEPAMDPKLQEDLSHAVVFASSMFSLSNTISYFLQHEADRLKSTENAYAFAKERLNAEFFLSQTCVTEFMA